jgi:hypothetical protein
VSCARAGDDLRRYQNCQGRSKKGTSRDVSPYSLSSLASWFADGIMRAKYGSPMEILLAGIASYKSKGWAPTDRRATSRRTARWYPFAPVYTDVLIDFLAGTEPVTSRMASYLEQDQLETTAITAAILRPLLRRPTDNHHSRRVNPFDVSKWHGRIER